MSYTNEQKARLFDALDMDGVDNWEGYFIEGGNYERESREIEAEQKYDENFLKLEPLIEIIEGNIDVDYPSEREAGAQTKLTEQGQIELVKFITKNYTFKL